MKLLFIGFELLIIATSAWKDVLNYRIEKGENKLKPYEKWVFRLFLILLVSSFAVIPNNSNEAVFCFGMSIAFMWGAIFDIIWNLLEGNQPILYVGTTSGIWSKFMAMNYLWAIIWRLFFIALSLILTFKLFTL